MSDRITIESSIEVSELASAIVEHRLLGAVIETFNDDVESTEIVAEDVSLLFQLFRAADVVNMLMPLAYAQFDRDFQSKPIDRTTLDAWLDKNLPLPVPDLHKEDGKRRRLSDAFSLWRNWPENKLELARSMLAHWTDWMTKKQEAFELCYRDFRDNVEKWASENYVRGEGCRKTK